MDEAQSKEGSKADQFALAVEKSGGDGGKKEKNAAALVRLFLACMVSGGIQYGWALQLSLLTPYSQTLGIPHKYASLTWICGPVAGFLVQPIVGYYSDRCTARMGQRRPFILVGCLLICISVMLIGFSADIGRLIGDTKEHCSTYTGPRYAAASVFVVAFWILDFANNTVQGPARALMFDLSAIDHDANVGQAIFAVWMAIGNILGFTAGANAKWDQWFPFLKTAACCDACANLKGAFFTTVLLLVIAMAVTMYLADEKPLVRDSASSAPAVSGCSAVFGDLFGSFKSLPRSMIIVFAMTALTWLSWFPFNLFSTDWFGREIYRGDPSDPARAGVFYAGVREGAVGLVLTSVTVLLASFLVPTLCRRLTSKVVWAISSLMVFFFMVVMVVVGVVSTKGYRRPSSAAAGPDPALRAIGFAVFALIGIPQAVLFTVPFAVASEVAQGERGGQQGLAIGVLNIAIVAPQLIISTTAGQIDKLFVKEDSNTPILAVGGVVALLCAVLALVLLPKTNKVAVMAADH